jgi:hypothetical protein
MDYARTCETEATLTPYIPDPEVMRNNILEDYLIVICFQGWPEIYGRPGQANNLSLRKTDIL